ncbi:hypothetical protein Pint_01513 [Pistacia integerrima]|uniref:Uncharacterized protein n=1 Tax=Pistacia integerrima TaxID=434235 RepID=A0ACC0ZHZ2_9ROSI|nr:hypothetical protein Pint_01513 [Pistacia integerrima]
MSTKISSNHMRSILQTSEDNEYCSYQVWTAKSFVNEPLPPKYLGKVVIKPPREYRSLAVK